MSATLTGIMSMVAKILADVILEVWQKFRATHHEGASDGTTEKRLRDKIRDHWNNA